MTRLKHLGSGNAGPLHVACPRCRARPGRRCFDPGPPESVAAGIAVPAHPERVAEARATACDRLSDKGDR